MPDTQELQVVRRRHRLDSPAAAFADAFPLTEGHTLVVTRRHVAGLFDLSAEEQSALFGLLPRVKARLG